MSIDYSANYGIGFQVTASAELEESEIYERFCDLLEYIEYHINTDFFDVFECGNAMMRNDMEYFVTIRDPDIYNVKENQYKEKILQALNEINVDTVGDFGLVGGYTIF